MNVDTYIYWRKLQPSSQTWGAICSVELLGTNNYGGQEGREHHGVLETFFVHPMNGDLEKIKSRDL